MTSAAIYARVSSARQAKDETIGSQLAALRGHAATSRLDAPKEWVFADDGHSGATLIRPGLEALRDLAWIRPVNFSSSLSLVSRVDSGLPFHS